MTAIIVTAGVVLFAVALVWAVAHFARLSGQMDIREKIASKEATNVRKGGEIVAEHRDADDIVERLRKHEF